MRRSQVFAVLGVLVIGGAGLMLALRDSGLGDGPLDAGFPGAYGQGLELGDAYTAGQVILLNEGDEPAVIERVRVLGVTDGIEVLGIHTRRVPGTDGELGTFIGAVGFPPQGYVTRPLAEQNVVPVPTEFTEGGSPAAGLELAIGVRATQPGVGRARGVEITYRVGGKRYREEINAGIYLCAPAADFTEDESCPGELMDRFSDEVVG